MPPCKAITSDAGSVVCSRKNPSALWRGDSSGFSKPLLRESAVLRLIGASGVTGFWRGHTALSAHRLSAGRLHNLYPRREDQPHKPRFVSAANFTPDNGMIATSVCIITASEMGLLSGSPISTFYGLQFSHGAYPASIASCLVPSKTALFFSLIFFTLLQSSRWNFIVFVLRM